MYAFPEMIDLANQQWRSPTHKSVAIALLIGNGRICKRQDLIEYGKIINALSLKEVRALTIGGAAEIGIPVN